MSTDERNPVSSTSFGIAVPQHVGRDGFDRRAFAAFLARAEALGFASGWVGEQVLGDAPDLGPVEALTFAAACTERMRLGCATFVSSLVSPLHLAKSLASLDQLSGGRLEVGLSTGGGFRQFAAFGVDRTTFVARFNECLTVMRLLWSQDRVDFDGRLPAPRWPRGRCSSRRRRSGSAGRTPTCCGAPSPRPTASSAPGRNRRRGSSSRSRPCARRSLPPAVIRPRCASPSAST
jgi:alkanesulfonate monooxygenase SsuD/methylene tetrahydromethanopterin reductase-like flavin-dependent oxidoreductase (luciferase family)